MRRKKSQMEIMGLAIIVVLLFLGMVFVIKFVVLKPPKEYKKEYTRTELASNVIGAMLYTTAPDCSKVTFAKLFQDCALGDPGSIYCGTKPPSEGGGSWYSCGYAAYHAKDILERTLGEDGLNLNYYFQVEANDADLPGFAPIGDSCLGERKQKRYPLPGASTIYVILDICD